MPLRSVLALLLAAYLTVAFAPPATGGEVPSPTDERGDCCDPSESGDDDCCPGGCHHCPMPCCGGSSALTGCSVKAPDIRIEESNLAPVASSSCRNTDPRRIDHPPRA